MKKMKKIKMHFHFASHQFVHRYYDAYKCKNSFNISSNNAKQWN